MSKRERVSDAIASMRIRLYYAQDGLCACCGAKLNWGLFERAHRIPARSWTIALWGPAVLNHQRNFAATCKDMKGGRNCNARMQLAPNSRQAAELAESIQKELQNGK